MESKRFGIEVEFTGVTRQQVVEVLEELFQTKAVSNLSTKARTPYVFHTVLDPLTGSGLWSVLRDTSVVSQFYGHNKPDGCVQMGFDSELITEDWDDYKVELVSPILTRETLPVLFTILTRLQALGAVVNTSTGLHVHVDVPETAEELVDLMCRFYHEHASIVSEFDPNPWRLENYCKRYPVELVQALENLEERGVGLKPYDVFHTYLHHLRVGVTEQRPFPEKYYMLSLRGEEKLQTVEFRLFNASLDPEEVQRIMDWVLDFTYPSLAVPLPTAL